MVKFPEAMVRMYQNVFVCRKCKTKQRASIQKVLKKQIMCKKCGCRALRPIKKGK
ncbi:50S ribosomal protein L40e [Candidatus Woesearchaeota archaeon]|nr:50S ribosomal protein L40e [Candidatus Woesearchaeota archaeon]